MRLIDTIRNRDECFNEEHYLNKVIGLLDAGADIHESNDYSLRFAVYFYMFDLVKLLVERGANIHVDDDWCFSYTVFNTNPNAQQIYNFLKNYKVEIDQYEDWED